MKQGVSVTPGRIFGNSPEYNRCIRLNYSFAWNSEIEAAVKKLGSIVSEAVADARMSAANAG